MSLQHPPFSTPLISPAKNMARILRAYPSERMCRLKLIAGTTASVVLIGWAAGVCAQSPGELAPPPLPPVVQGDAAQNNEAPAAQTPASQPDNAQPPQQATAAPANDSTDKLPPLQLGPHGAREVQSQLIALGFDPGPADGEIGPATVAAAQRYNENRGGSGPVPMDGALLTRLQQDTGPRLTPEQVAARSQPRYRASAASNPLANAIQRFGAKLRAVFNGGS